MKFDALARPPGRHEALALTFAAIVVIAAAPHAVHAESGSRAGSPSAGLTTARPSGYVQPCLDAWAESPASAHCPSAGVTRVGASTAGDRGRCVIRAAGTACSISATVGTGENSSVVTWHPAISKTVRLKRTGDLDLLLPALSAGKRGYRVVMRAACRAGEKDSSAATTTGLPQPAAGLGSRPAINLGSS